VPAVRRRGAGAVLPVETLHRVVGLPVLLLVASQHARVLHLNT
jgi:hypothetical protein